MCCNYHSTCFYKLTFSNNQSKFLLNTLLTLCNALGVLSLPLFYLTLTLSMSLHPYKQFPTFIVYCFVWRAAEFNQRFSTIYGVSCVTRGGDSEAYSSSIKVFSCDKEFKVLPFLLLDSVFQVLS